MRRTITTAVLFLLIASASPAQDFTTAPDWTLRTPDGEMVNLAEESAHRTTVLFFWATWCPYCKALMPHLQSMQLQYGDAIRILAINIREDGDPVGLFRDEGYDFTLLLDGDEVAELYDVRGTPGLFVVDRERRIVFDLRKQPRIEPPETDRPASHRRKASFRAPIWAARIRESIDSITGAER